MRLQRGFRHVFPFARDPVPVLYRTSDQIPFSLPIQLSTPIRINTGPPAPFVIPTARLFDGSRDEIGLSWSVFADVVGADVSDSQTPLSTSHLPNLPPSTTIRPVTDERDAQKRKHDNLQKQRPDEFMAGFNLIFYEPRGDVPDDHPRRQCRTGVGRRMDPFSEAIIFSVMPPKKSWKNISNLSGGEKFSGPRVRAPRFQAHSSPRRPLDAALDFRSVSIVANYIKDQTKNAQFIIILLRNDVFEPSHRLIGIYKTANATQSIVIHNHILVPTKSVAPATTSTP